jgi:ABC-2 type transport system ATP-binding protein
VSAPALEIVEVVKAYGDRRAVDGICLTVERGQILALLGPNGAGKTTTIEICEGYRRPDSGTVRVLGGSPGDPAVRPRVGIMLQEGIGGYTAAKARELVELFASYARHPMGIDELLEAVGLSASAHIPVKRLSGGQRQRLSLALALVGRPELVFLDEPTAGMDPHARRSAWNLIGALREDGVTVVLSTHHLDEAEQLADAMAVIDAGRIAALGTLAELTRGGPTGQIRFAAPTGLDLPALIAELPAGATATEGPPGQYQINAVVDPAMLAALTAWCARNGVLAEGLTVARRSLEDVFLALTRAGGAAP